MVGLAYHAGVLRALDEEAGVRPEAADLVVGTSAGSVVGAYLRSGWTTGDFWEAALEADPARPSLTRAGPSQSGAGSTPGAGTTRGAAGRPSLAGPLLAGPGGALATQAGSAAGRALAASAAGRALADLPEVLVPAFTSPFELMRRGLGSAFVLSRTVLRVPAPVIPGPLRRAFPGGMFAMGEGQRRLEEELPGAWPEQALWLCALDIVSGHRIVLGRRGAPRLSLPRAVAASCAIPGVYPPVKLGRRVLVDGGAHSSTNLDLAAQAGCPLIVAIAPMAFDSTRPPSLASQLVRRIPARSLAQEAAGARRRGAEVLMIRPSGAEVRAHGLNLMRRDGLDRIAKEAYQSAARLLVTERFRRALAPFGA